MLINIDVPDLAAAIRFYESATGLRLTRRLFDGSVAEMHGAGVPVYLLEAPAGPGATASGNAARDYNRHWTPVHLDFTSGRPVPRRRNWSRGPQPRRGGS